jgi:hypothetical protein
MKASKLRKTIVQKYSIDEIMSKIKNNEKY